MDQLYKSIVSFQHRCNDYMDDPEHPTAQTLLKEVQRLEDEAQMRKGAAALEDQVEQVIRLLEQTGKAEAMSYHHVDELIDECEDFRKELRKLG